MISATMIAFRALFIVGKFSLRHQENISPILKSFLYFNKKVRISVAALLVIEDDDKYILIKNHHREEYYAPIGGVYKHITNKPEILDKIEWNSDYTTHVPKLDDMKNDLRGVVHGKYLPDFINWFISRKGRENEQCLYRELKEELKEGRVGKGWRDRSSDIKMELVRPVIEGPRKIEGRDYDAQFRYFELYRPDRNDEVTNEIVNEVIKRAYQGDNNLVMVNKKEILEGRMKGDRKLVAGTAKYFFSSDWHGSEPERY